MTTEIQFLLLSLSVIYVTGQDLQSTGGMLIVEDKPQTWPQGVGGGGNPANLDTCQACGICKLPVRDECEAYIQCDSGHPARKMYCPFGTFFNPGLQNCDRPTNVTCLSDPCRRRGVQSHAAAGSSCNLFWKCVDGRSTPDCCNEGYSYDVGARRCIRNSTCNDTCSLRGGSHVQNIRPQHTKIVCEGTSDTISCGANQEIQINKVNWGRTNNPPECGIASKYTKCFNENDILVKRECNGRESCVLRADPSLYTDTCPGIPKYLEVQYECREGCYLVIRGNDPRNFYNQERLNANFTCPIGTIFDPNSCVCVNSGQAGKVCLLEVHITFDRIPERVINKMNVHIAPTGIKKESGFGLFSGQSVIVIPFYSGNDNLSKAFALQLRIYASLNRQPKQILLSNCVANERDSSSLEIFIARTPTANLTVFRVVPSDPTLAPKEMALPLLIKQWTNILFSYDGKQLNATLQYIDPVTKLKTEKNASERFSDKIKVSPGPMMIGGCLERYRYGSRVYDGVHTYIDEIQMSFCKVAFPRSVVPPELIQ